jgi:hypothetical protein
MALFGSSNKGISIKEQWSSNVSNNLNKELSKQVTNMIKNNLILTKKDVELITPTLLADIPVSHQRNKATIQLNYLKEVVPCLISAKENEGTSRRTVTAIKDCLSTLASKLVIAANSRSNIIPDDMDNLLSELLNGLNNYGIVVNIDSRTLDLSNTLMNDFYHKIPVETGRKDNGNE